MLYVNEMIKTQLYLYLNPNIIYYLSKNVALGKVTKFNCFPSAKISFLTLLTILCITQTRQSLTCLACD